jgi:hypothetical protein
MKQFFWTVTLFLLTLSANGQPMLAVEDNQRIDAFKLTLPAKQLEEFQKLDMYQQRLPYQAAGEDWIVPVLRELNGKLIAVPQSPSSNQSLLKDLSLPATTVIPGAADQLGTPSAIRIDNLQTFLAPESLNTLFFNSEVALQRDLFERQTNIMKSVAPGEIKSISDLPGQISTEYTIEAINAQLSWAGDPCNKARTNFHVHIESRMEDMFATLGDDGVLQNGPTLIEREKLAEIAKSYDKECLLTLNDAIDQGYFPVEYKPRIAILTKDDWPLCGALRVTRNEYITARHCFYSASYGTPEDYTAPLLSGNFQNRIHVHNLNTPKTKIRVKSLLLDNTSIGSASKPYEISGDYLFFETVEQTLSSDPNISSVLEKAPHGEIHEPLILVGYFAFHNPEWRFQLPGAPVEPWQNGLRLTKGSYCRIFDRSHDNLCIAHACQSMALFSGGPLMGRINTSPEEVLPGIRMLGVHSRAGSSARGCGRFVQTEGKRPATGPQGGLALSSEWIFGDDL